MTHCRPSRRDINVVVTIGFSNYTVADCKENARERERLFTSRARCYDDTSVNPARFEPRLWRRLVPITYTTLWLSNTFRAASRFVEADSFAYSPVLSSLLLLSSSTEHSKGIYIYICLFVCVYIYISIFICNFTRPRRKCCVYSLFARVYVVYVFACFSPFARCANRTTTTTTNSFIAHPLSIAKEHQGNEDFSFPNWSTLKRKQSARSPPSNSCQN